MKSNEPHVMLSDDDGHWYLVPKSKVQRFEELVELIPQDPENDKLMCAWDKLPKIQIDDPSNIKIFEWEEI